MKLLINLLILNLLVAAVFCLQRKDNVQRTKCPQVNCVDPQHDPKTGCMSCEKSQCKFRGCVKFGAYGPSWMPDNCTVCYCEEGSRKEVCTKMECPKKDCFGFPTIHKPNRCCPECDFSSKVADTECAAVPVKRKSMYVALGDKSCQRDVVTYGCDKEYITDEEGAWFSCKPVMVNVTLSFPDCHHGHMIGHVMYEEVRTCEKKRMELHEIPMDFDPSPSWDCPLYVDPL